MRLLAFTRASNRGWRAQCPRCGNIFLTIEATVVRSSREGGNSILNFLMPKRRWPRLTSYTEGVRCGPLGACGWHGGLDGAFLAGTYRSAP